MATKRLTAIQCYNATVRDRGIQPTVSVRLHKKTTGKNLSKNSKKGTKQAWDFASLETKNMGRANDLPVDNRVFIPETPLQRLFRHFFNRVSRFFHHMGFSA